jgi:hypothetical protein
MADFDKVLGKVLDKVLRMTDEVEVVLNFGRSENQL